MLIRIKVIYYLKLLISIKTQNQKMLVKQSKKDTLDSLNALFEGRKMVLNTFQSGILRLHTSKGLMRQLA